MNPYWLLLPLGITIVAAGLCLWDYKLTKKEQNDKDKSN